MIVGPATVGNGIINVRLMPTMNAFCPPRDVPLALKPELLRPKSEPVILPSNDSEREVSVLQVKGYHLMRCQATVWRLAGRPL